LEIKILSHLLDAQHASSLRTIRTLEPDMQEAISCSVFDLRDDGLVSTRELTGDHLVSLTPRGREVLSAILSGKTSC
jgi:hypothetical protein